MRIPIDTFALILSSVALALWGTMFVVHDRVIRHVCRREELEYPALWILDPSWILRFGQASWLQSAKTTPYFKIDVTLAVLWIVLIFSSMILMVSGFISFAAT